MNIFELSRKSLIVMLLSLMALVMLPACSSTEETPAAGTPPPTGETPSELEDCSVYTGQADITECEIRNQMRQ